MVEQFAAPPFPSMTNHEIARRFERIGDILEIQGENPFKVKAYRRAAEAIDNLVEPLADIDARGGLPEIAGFGEAIIAKTRDFLQTGTTKLWEQVKDAVSPGVLAMAAVPGVGPRTAKTLHEALGVANVEELEQACRDGRVRTVAGFGPGKEAKLLEAIERGRRLSERLPLYVALPYAERLARELAARPEVSHAQVAGSLRRGPRHRGRSGPGCRLVRSRSDHARLCSTARCDGGYRAGPSKTAVLTDLGLRADLRVGAERDFGALLHHFSSGRNHNRKLRDIAESRGLKINEYGVFDAASGQERAGGATEDEIYQALGLPPIPPELREDTGEIEAAQRGELPDLVTLADFQGQLHCHSTHSDGSARSAKWPRPPSRAATRTLPSPTTARMWASPTA
jgi:DNA polymerase (family 10)